MTDRKLSAFGAGTTADPGNPGADPDGVDPDRDDRPEYVRGDDGAGGLEDDPTCTECDSTAAYEDPSEALGTDSLPAVPLCRSHILEHK